MNENSCRSASLPTFGIVVFFDSFDHSNKNAVLSHCGFNLLFPKK